MGDPITSNHGVTQGRNSSCNIFSYYISDMKIPVENLRFDDFTDPENLLQLGDDTIVFSEYLHSLSAKFRIVNTGKTKYMHLCKNPSLENIVIGEIEFIKTRKKPHFGAIFGT